MNERIAISMTEAAAMIGVSKSKMYEIAKRNDVDFVVLLGGRRLVSKTRLEDWINRQAGSYKS